MCFLIESFIGQSMALSCVPDKQLVNLASLKGNRGNSLHVQREARPPTGPLKLTNHHISLLPSIHTNPEHKTTSYQLTEVMNPKISYSRLVARQPASGKHCITLIIQSFALINGWALFTIHKVLTHSWSEHPQLGHPGPCHWWLLCLMAPTKMDWTGYWKNFLQPIYSSRHLLSGAAVPVSSKTFRTWAEQLGFSLPSLAYVGQEGQRKVERCWGHGKDKMYEINLLRIVPMKQKNGEQNLYDSLSSKIKKLLHFFSHLNTTNCEINIRLKNNVRKWWFK